MGVELGGCASCSKWLLIIFNVLIFLVGVALLAVGIYVIVQPFQLQVLEILDNPIIKNGAYLIIGIGCFIIVVSGLGCFGACCQSKCLLIIYFIVILIILVAQLVGCALVLAYRGQVDSFVTTQLQSTMDRYNGETATDTISTAWNALQILLECCGTNNYTDWEATPWGNASNQTYPSTCCVYTDKNTVLTGNTWPTPADMSACYGSVPNDYLNSVGCYSAFQTFVENQIYYIGGVGIGLLVLEILAMIFAIVLCRGISKGEDVV